MSFEWKYAIKSIYRRMFKNSTIIIAIAFGVAIFASAQIGSRGLLLSEGRLNIEKYGKTHLQISGSSQTNGFFPLNITDQIREVELSHSEKIEIISPKLSLHSSVYHKGSFENSIYILGIQPKEDNFGHFYSINGSVINLAHKITNSSQLTGIISSNLAEKIQLVKFDIVNVTFTTNLGYTSVPINVTDIYNEEVGRGTVTTFGGEHQIYVNLNRLQLELSTPDDKKITHIAIKFSNKAVTTDYSKIDFNKKSFPGKEIVKETAEEIEELAIISSFDFQVNSGWVEVAEKTKEEMDFTSNLTMFNIFLNIIALLLIVNIQIITMLDRKYQTAILRALGASKLRIVLIFLIESFLIGVIGAIFGLGIGYLLGQFIIRVLGNIFHGGAILFSGFSLTIVLTSIIFGILLSVITALIPAIQTSRKPITDSIRGIETPEKKQKNYYLSLIFGIILVGAGLFFMFQSGKIWRKEAWGTFEEQTNFILAIGLTIGGLGFILSEFINNQIALNISGLSFLGLAIFNIFVALNWLEPTEYDPGMWSAVVVIYLMTGIVLIIATNFKYILKGFNYLLSLIKSFRGSAQVTIKMMLGKKAREIFAFTIITSIFFLTFFMSSMAETQRISVVEDHSWRSRGINIQVTSNIPNENISQTIDQIAGVRQVFAFRSVFMQLYKESPHENNTEFDPNNDLTYRRIVEVPEEIINPNNNWDNYSLPFSFYQVRDNKGYEFSKHYSSSQNREVSINILEDFFNNRNFTEQVTYKEKNETGGIQKVVREENHIMAIGDSLSQFDELNQVYYLATYTQSNYLSITSFTSCFNMLGSFSFLGGALLVTPEVAEQLPVFETVPAPNIFLVRTDNGFSSIQKNQALAQTIENDLNNLNDSNSLSSQENILIGGSTKLVYQAVSNFYEINVKIWQFMNTYILIGLVIGSLGLVVISVRSVFERTREIGMMRAIGFSQTSVVVSVLLELFILMTLAIFCASIIGFLFSVVFSIQFFGIPPTYPVGKILLYILLLLVITLVAGVIPGYRAAKIEPSDALRYE